MDNEKINIASLQINTADLEESNAKVIKQIKELKETQKALRKETGNLIDANVEQTKQYVSNDAQLKSLNKSYNLNRAVLAESTTSVKGLTTALEKEVQSLGAAKKNNKELIAAREGINGKTKEGQKAIELINKKIDQNTEFTKNNSSAVEKQKVNIGNYASALDNVVPGLGNVATGLQAGADKSRIFGTALKAIPILLLLSGLLALGKAFASTQKGMDEINKVVRPLKVIFESLVGVIQDLAISGFEKLKEAINNPKQALKELGDLIVENVINRFKALSVLGEAVSKLLKGDFAGAAKTATDGIIQLGTGVTNATDKIQKASDQFRKFTDEASRQGIELDNIIKRIEKLQINSTVPLAKATNELRKQKQIAEDVTRTEQERLRAASIAEEKQRFIVQEQQRIQDLKIKQKELENSFNDTSRADELELQQLIAERYELETAGVEALTTLQNLKNTIALQGIAKEKQAVKEALDLDKKAAEESIKIAKDADEKAAAEKRLRQSIEFQEELQRLEEEGASREAIQIARINNSEQLQIEAAQREIENKELLERELSLIEMEADTARKEVRQISDAEQLDQTKQFYGTLSELLGKDTVAAKAAGLAKAAINTYQGVTEVFRSPSVIPEPFGTIAKIANAGIILKTGLSTVSKINSVNTPKAERGALIELGGKRHSQGGTTLFDESGSAIVEAERGEVMGVMNRNAARLFMDFNNQYRDGSYSNPFGQFAMSGRSGGSLPGMTDKRMVNGLKELKAEIKSKPVASIKVDKDGFETSISDGFQKEIYLNKKFNG